MNPLVDIVIVNYNAGEVVVDCIRSVYDQREPVRLTVVDNASTDGSDEKIAGAFEDREHFTLLKNRDNRGFAAAVNQAAAVPVSKAPYLLVLNPDCEMLPGSIAALTAALEANESAALAGPLVIDADKRPARGTLRRFPDPWRSLLTFSGLWRLERQVPAFEGVEVSGELPSEIAVAEAVSGACMMLKRSAFDELGGLDEAYGLHCEDLDLMYRLRASGRCSLFVPGAKVIHRQGVSSRSRPLWVHRQKHRGMQRFFQKHQARNYAFPLRWLVVGGIWVRYVLTLPFVVARR
jgi:GT2 family glycosyltransferase